MALAVLLATIPAFIAEARFSGAAFRLRNWRSPDSRRLNYLEYVLANDEHAKEVKLFGLGPLLLGRYKRLAETFYDEDRRLALRRTVWGYGLSLLSTVAFYGCYALIVAATVRGRLTLGEMTLYLVAFRQGQQSFQSILTALGGMYEDNLYMSNLFDYFAIPTGRAARRGPRGGPCADEEGVRFEGVGFRYPGGDKWALRGIDVFVPKGQSLALVGENGAGKTTFIKLLAGLYEPTEGRILLDGRDLRTWDEAELRARIGVIFQDFNEYQLALRENVGFGSVDHLDDELRVGRAVDQGGANELVAGLAAGHRDAARALVQGGRRAVRRPVAEGRARPRLHARGGRHPDPRRADRGARRRGRARRLRALPALAAGRTTILISHRFPTVRMADRILVIEAGVRRRGRQPRRAGRRRPQVRAAVQPAGGGLRIVPHLAPNSGFNAAAHAIFPSRCRWKSGCPLRFCDSNPCFATLWRIARNLSRSRRGRFMRSLMTTPHSCWRRPRCMTRVLRWLMWKPSSRAMAATRGMKKRSVLAKVSSPAKARSSAYLVIVAPNAAARPASRRSRRHAARLLSAGDVGAPCGKCGSRRRWLTRNRCARSVAWRGWAASTVSGVGAVHRPAIVAAMRLG